MLLKITFPGGAKVAADFGAGQVLTDQPVAHGGEGSAASPFVLFLASLGTCAGYYVLKFCQSRELSLEGISIDQQNGFDRESGKLTDVKITINLPADFPEKYRAAVIRAADQCAVKRALADPPKIVVETATV